MSKTFQVIVADPPWSFSDKLTMAEVARGAEANYSVMTMRDIKDLPISQYADPNGSVLALWVPSSLLQDGLDTMKAWGYTHKQTYVWVKTKKDPFKSTVSEVAKAAKDGLKQGKTIKSIVSSALSQFDLNDLFSFGMGRLFRQTHEIALIGTNNNGIYKLLKNKSQRSVSNAPNLKHSAKPDDIQKSLELMFPDTTKLELFARRKLDGWTCLGNEVCDGEDIRDSLAKL